MKEYKNLKECTMFAMKREKLKGISLQELGGIYPYDLPSPTLANPRQTPQSLKTR